MQMAFRLNIEQTQKLIMTPELRQAIMILQLSALELSEYIDQELLENPLLEMEADSSAEKVDDMEEEEPYDIDWQEYFADSSDLGYTGRGSGFSRQSSQYSFEHYYTRELTLCEHLLGQFHLQTERAPMAAGGIYPGNLDEHGYHLFHCEIARLQQVLVEEVVAVLEIIRSLDPRVLEPRIWRSVYYFRSGPGCRGTGSWRRS